MTGWPGWPEVLFLGSALLVWDFTTFKIAFYNVPL